MRGRGARTVHAWPGDATRSAQLGRSHPPGRARVRPSRCSGYAVGAPWRIRANTSPPALRSQALCTIAPKSFCMMVWSFWAADALRSDARARSWWPGCGGQRRSYHGREAASSAAWRVRRGWQLSRSVVVLQRVRRLPAPRTGELPPRSRAPQMVADARRRWLGARRASTAGYRPCGSTTTTRARGERVLSCVVASRA